MGSLQNLPPTSIFVDGGIEDFRLIKLPYFEDLTKRKHAKFEDFPLTDSTEIFYNYSKITMNKEDYVS